METLFPPGYEKIIDQGREEYGDRYWEPSRIKDAAIEILHDEGFAQHGNDATSLDKVRDHVQEAGRSGRFSEIFDRLTETARSRG